MRRSRSFAHPRARHVRHRPEQTAFDNNPAMRRGESGDAVRLVQEALVELAFPLPRSTNPTTKELDGDFGAETQGAVFDFQGTFTLPSRDGVVGRQTLGKLDELHGGAPSAPPLLIHEFNHMIGAQNEAGARGQVRAPADAFNNADSMAEYVTQLNGAQTDRCRDP
jgi:hypothetical protein